MTTKKTQSSNSSQPKKVASSSKSKAGSPLGHGVGRRKSAIARVWLRRGNGKIAVNGREMTSYFDTTFNQSKVDFPLKALSLDSNYTVQVNVKGGGVNAQADAVKLGIARALVSIDESIRKNLRKFRLLTVDPRVKERKKFGQRGARAKFQFTKR